MAKMVLENTRPHMISLHAAGDQVKTVSIPGARPDEEQKMVNGRAEVDGEIVAQARKNSKVVKAYFDDGWLREVKSSPAETKAA